MAYRISGKALVTIGRKMKSARKSEKRTQVEVAVEAGIDSSYYARIERGEANPSLEVLNAIIKALPFSMSSRFTSSDAASSNLHPVVARKIVKVK